MFIKVHLVFHISLKNTIYISHVRQKDKIHHSLVAKMYTKSSSSLQRGRKIQSTKSQNVFSSYFRNFMNCEKSLSGKQIKFHIQGQSFSELPQCLITWMLIHIAVPKVTMIFWTNITYPALSHQHHSKNQLLTFM